MLLILFKILGSEIAKRVIIAGMQALLEHAKDGVTKDVAENVLDAIAQSRSNGVSREEVDVLKGSL